MLISRNHSERLALSWPCLQLQCLRTLLRRAHISSGQIVPVLRARVPILKFVEAKSGGSLPEARGPACVLLLGVNLVVRWRPLWCGPPMPSG